MGIYSKNRTQLRENAYNELLEKYKDTSIFESIIDIQKDNMDLFDEIIGMDFSEAYNEAGLIFLTEDEEVSKGKGILSKIVSKTKEMISKGMDQSKAAFKKVEEKIKDSSSKDIYDKYNNRFMFNANRGYKYKTTHPNILKDNLDEYNTMLNISFEIKDVESKYWSKVFTLSGDNGDYHKLNDDEVKSIVDEAKEEMDKKFDQLKSMYDTAVEETEEKEIDISKLSGMISAEMNPESHKDFYPEKYIKEKEDSFKKDLAELDKKVKEYENSDDEFYKEYQRYAQEAKADYDMASYACKKIIEADRMAISYFQKFFAECRKAFITTATHGRKNGEESQEESARISALEELSDIYCEDLFKDI